MMQMMIAIRKKIASLKLNKLKESIANLNGTDKALRSSKSSTSRDKTEVSILHQHEELCEKFKLQRESLNAALAKVCGKVDSATIEEIY